MTPPDITAAPTRPPQPEPIRWRLIGPGLVVAATGVGASDMVATLVAGSRYGYALLWAVIAGVLIKIALVEGAGRYSLATGRTIFEGWRSLGAWTSWYFGPYIILWGFVYGATAMSSSALPLAAAFPALSLTTWAILMGLLGFVMVWFGRYALFERITAALVGVMFVVVVGLAVIAVPNVPSMLTGLVPTLPGGDGGLMYTLALAGGVGGTITLAAYGYWLREKGWSTPAWMRVMRIDNAAAYGLTGVFVIAMLIVGAEVVRAAGVSLGASDEGLLGLRAVLADRYGPTVATGFLVGFWAASFSSLLGVWNGVSLMFADYWGNLRGLTSGHPDTRVGGRYFRFYLLWLTFPPMLLFQLDRPIGLIVAYGVLGALFMPFLAVTLLGLLNGPRVSTEWRNGPLTNAAMLVCAVVFVVLGASQLWSAVTSGLATMRRTASSTAAPGETARQDARPNIVFVLLDDVRYDDLVNHPFVALPNLAQLAAEGASFEHFYTSAPLCSPSRAVFLTGQYPYRNGIIDNGERAERSHQIVTFPKLLQDAGYHTGFFGKWHMGHEDDSPRPGFDRWVSFVGQGTYFDPALNIDGRPDSATGYMTDILTNEAVAFIEAAPDSQPFLVVMAQKAVHPEIHPNYVRSFPPAPGDEELYAHDDVPHGPSWRAPTTGKPALERPHDASDPRSPAGGLPDSVVRNRLRMLSAIDRSLGTLIATLEARGVYDQTLFVVTSDQGFFYGEFGLAQERRLAYEPSIHIPLIVRHPGLVKAGARPRALASNVDLAPTMLALGGVAIPATMDGRSLLPALASDTATLREDLLIEYYSDTEFPRLQGMGYDAVRTSRYKLIRYRELQGMDELYDLQRDPHELDNLLPDRAPEGVVRTLTARLEALRSLGGDAEAPR